MTISAVLLLAGGVFAADRYMSRPSGQSTVESTETAKTDPIEQPTPPTRAELLKLVNAERKKAGVAPLKEDKRLDWSAQQKADDMVRYNYSSHISPTNSPFAGIHGYEFIDKSGLKCVLEGENLVGTTADNNSSSYAIEKWVKSVAHYKAMIDSRYTITGFGIAQTSGNSAVLVQHFCQPA